jgi:hypothetical protein
MTAGVFAVALALYARAASFDLAHVDDDLLLISERAFLEKPSALVEVFSRPYFVDAARDHSYYRPLVAFSYALDTLCGGGYHLTNVVLHALSAALSFPLLRRLGYGDTTAALGATAFAVHPALTEAVAWIPGRPDLMMTLFALGSFWCWLSVLERPAPWPRVSHLVLWFGALLCKETALVLPLVYAAFARLWQGRPLKQVFERGLVLGQLAILCAYAALRLHALPRGLGIDAASLIDAAGNLPALIASAGKLVWPYTLSVLATPEDTPLWPGLVALLLVGWAFRSRRLRNNRVAFAAFAFAACALPNLPASGQLILESRLYLAAVPAIVLACEVIERARLARELKWGLSSLCVAALATRTLAYLPSFRDRESFAVAAVEGSPRLAHAHKNHRKTRQQAGYLGADQ